MRRLGRSHEVQLRQHYWLYDVYEAEGSRGGNKQAWLWGLVVLSRVVQRQLTLTNVRLCLLCASCVPGSTTANGRIHLSVLVLLDDIRSGLVLRFEMLTVSGQMSVHVMFGHPPGHLACYLHYCKSSSRDGGSDLMIPAFDP